MKLEPKQITRWLMTLFTASSIAALAGEACFTADGKRVYLVPQDNVVGKIEEIGLDDGTHRFLTFQQHPGPGDILQIQCLNDGSLLLLCKDAVWNWSADHKHLKTMQTAAEGSSFTQMALSRSDGALALWCRQEKPDELGRTGTLLFAKTPQATPVMVRLRRVDYVTGMCFHGKRELLFGTEGDLWNGTIEEESDDYVSLSAQRFAPLSDRETYNGTPSQIGVFRIAVSAGKIYTHLHRMGGSGWGHVVRLSLPADCQPKTKTNDIRDQLQIYSNALNSVEVLEENGSLSFLCTSFDGRRVFFTNGLGKDRTHFLVENDGVPQPIKVLPAQE